MRIDRSRRLNPGLLRERGYIRHYTEGTQDSYGQPPPTWSVFQQVQARVVTLRGRELEAVQQRWAEARFRVETHYVPGVQRAMQFVWGDLIGSEPAPTARVLNILDAEDPYGNRAFLFLYCKEWVK